MGPLCTYYSFLFCVFMVFLWRVKCVFLYIYMFSLYFFVDSFSSVFLFCLFSFYLSFILLEKHRVWIMVGGWEPKRSGGRGDNQNILYDNKSIFNKTMLYKLVTHPCPNTTYHKSWFLKAINNLKYLLTFLLSLRF